MVTQPETESTAAANWCETQRMRDVWWIVLAVGGITLVAWFGFVQQILLGHPFGSNPGPNWSVWLIWLGFGIAFPLVFWLMRLSVEVSPETVLIRYIPLIQRSISLAEIAAVRARQYHPILEYGGWGIRGWWRGRTIYSVRGNHCVELELRDGRIVAVGSRRADEFAAAVAKYL